LLKDRLKKGKEQLDLALETLFIICEPVLPPKDILAYIQYFCGNPELEADLKERENRRTALYRHIVKLIRAYANISAEMLEAGYSVEETNSIKIKVDKYLKLREEIRLASGEKIDMKAYEADMRHLIDTYIQADASRRIDPFGDQSLLDIMEKSGIASAISNLPGGIKSNKSAVAESIENNIRVKIIKDHLIDPAYFDEMSKLLSEIIKERKENALIYEEYLKKIAELAKKVNNPNFEELPPTIKTSALRALYNNLMKNENLALEVNKAVLRSRRADWRGNMPSERLIKKEIFDVLKNTDEVERIFQIIKQQYEY